MIYYYSGTGNSRYVARKISQYTQDSMISLNDLIKLRKYPSHEADKIIFVAPTYGWRIPRIVSEWIEKCGWKKACSVWFVLTCGSEMGNAARYNRVLCEKKNLRYMGSVQIVMPENYIAMFNAPQKKEADAIIEKAEPEISVVSEMIIGNQAFPEPRCNLYDKVMSSVVNPFFYRFCVTAKHFYAKDDCMHCGKCTDVCPLGNIRLVDGKPVWANRCTHCMACIAYCPVEAIEYGKKSEGKPRYHLDK